MPEHASEVVGRGGRLGTIEALSGSYTHDVRLPGVKRDGVTPEELIAGAWAAFFGMTFIDSARSRDIDATTVEYKARVVLDFVDGEYTITKANLQIDAPDIDPELLRNLIDQTHARCPVSKALTNGAANLSLTSGSISTEDNVMRRTE